MIKRTLYFGNPAYLSLRNAQLVIHLPGANGMDDKTGNNTVPVEDIGVMILDHKQITITHGLLDTYSGIYPFTFSGDIRSLFVQK